MRLEVPYSPVTPNPVPELKIEASRESQFNGPDSVDSSFAGIPITLVLPSSQNFPGIDDEGQQENTFESVSASEKVLVSILKSSSKGNQIGGMYREEADANVQDSGLLLSEEEDRHQDERVDLGVRKQSSLSCSFSLQSEAADGEGKSTETEIKVESGRKHRWPVEGDERLTVGLIDYALLIGPAELGFNNNPLSTANMSFSLKRDAKRVQVQYSLHPDSENGFTAHNTFGAQFRDLNAPQSPLSLTTSKSSGSGGSTMESDMCIWDRFPLEDHDESPLPAKIEYFACPDGSKTLTAATRSVKRFNLIILSQYGY